MKQFFYSLHYTWARRLKLLLLGGLFLGGSLYNCWPTMPAAALANRCVDVQFIFARGSGEPLSGPSQRAWQSSITAELSQSALTYDFYELGSQAVDGYQYPAASVSGSAEGISNLIGAYISGGAAFKFGASVEQGRNELKAVIRQISASCPSTKFVLGGYSQGAMLISGLLDQLDSSKIAYVATFGDPKLYLPEGELKHSHLSNRLPSSYRQIPDACTGRNLSPYREHVPDCYAYEGVLGSYRPYQPSDYNGKLSTWCNDHDIMCSSGLNIADHTAYVATNLYADAARVIVEKLATAFPHHVVITTNPHISAHDVAVLIDSTNSMAGLIDSYRSEAKQLAERVITSGGRIALFEYRDLIDHFPTTMHCDFSCTLEEFTAEIDSIQVSGGGDLPESALSALLTTMNSLAWQSGATKSIVLLTDAPYHSPDRDHTTVNDVVFRSLEIDPVNLYIMTTAETAPAYATLAERTNGRVFDAAEEIALSTDTILSRPVAQLALAAYAGAVGAEFSFDATSSYSAGGATLSFDWDLDGDGIFELVDATAIVTKAYDQPFQGFIQVRVRSGELASTMSAPLTVTATGQIKLASISGLSATPLSDTSARVSFQTDAEQVLLLVNDAVFGLLAADQREFTLTDLTDTVAITLIPYAADGRKGISETLTFTPVSTQLPSLPLAPNTGVKSVATL